jgi:hypothetical protein
VFFENASEAPLPGQLVSVRITWTGPWSLLGRPASELPLRAVDRIPIRVENSLSA